MDIVRRVCPARRQSKPSGHGLQTLSNASRTSASPTFSSSFSSRYSPLRHPHEKFAGELAISVPNWHLHEFKSNAPSDAVVEKGGQDTQPSAPLVGWKVCSGQISQLSARAAGEYDPAGQSCMGCSAPGQKLPGRQSKIVRLATYSPGDASTTVSDRVETTSSFTVLKTASTSSNSATLELRKSDT
eukprot:scaffold1302_cov245-Pinguiococcus_pyrenoidosus.AAC.4